MSRVGALILLSIFLRMSVVACTAVLSKSRIVRFAAAVVYILPVSVDVHQSYSVRTVMHTFRVSGDNEGYCVIITITILWLLYCKTYTVAETIILSWREKGIIIIGHNSRGRVEGVKEKNPIDENYAVNVDYPYRPDQTLRTTTVTSIEIRNNLGSARSVFCRFERVPGPAPLVPRSEAAAAPYFTRYVRSYRSVTNRCRHTTQRRRREFIFSSFLHDPLAAHENTLVAAPLPSWPLL